MTIMYTYAKLTGKMTIIYFDITHFSSRLIIFDNRFGIWTLIDTVCKSETAHVIAF